MYIGNISFEEIKNLQDIRNHLKSRMSRYRDQTILPMHYPYELEKKLYTAMLSGDLEGVQEVSREYSQFPVSVLCRGNPIRSLKNMMICNCSLITRAMIQGGLYQSYAYFLSDIYINKIESLNDENSLIYLNNLMIVDFMTAIKNSMTPKGHESSPLIRRAIDYIEENIDTHISLQEAADALHTNSSYLSRIFKREQGVTFTEYAHRSRMKKAKPLLLLSDLTIIAIANDLGYSSQSHFTQTFRRICGMTPRQYRRNGDVEKLLAKGA